MDPHYEGRAVKTASGRNAYWTCYVTVGKGARCGRELRLDGEKVPIAADIEEAVSQGEPPLSSQP